MYKSIVNDDNQREYSMLQSDIDSEDMFQLLMDSFDHQMLLECEDIVSIVEWIDRNKTILVLDVDHLLLSYDY